MQMRRPEALEERRPEALEWSLNQDCQEHKGSSAALVPLEIPRKSWPSACLVST